MFGRKKQLKQKAAVIRSIIDGLAEGTMLGMEVSGSEAATAEWNSNIESAKQEGLLAIFSLSSKVLSIIRLELQQRDVEINAMRLASSEGQDLGPETLSAEEIAAEKIKSDSLHELLAVCDDSQEKILRLLGAEQIAEG